MTSNRILQIAQRAQAIGQAGVAYATNQYDLERYEELRRLSAELLAEISDEPLEKICRAFTSDVGYQTPKVDIRAVVFDPHGRILMVRETIDGNRWTLPGGWADVGSTPFEVAVKETRGESGLIVEPVRLLALLDKSRHNHPPQLWYAYKVFIECKVKGGELAPETSETSGALWFTEEETGDLDLSLDRLTPDELRSMFSYWNNQARAALCD